MTDMTHFVNFIDHKRVIVLYLS